MNIIKSRLINRRNAILYTFGVIQIQKDRNAVFFARVDDQVHNVFEAEIANFALGKLQHHRGSFVFSGKANGLKNVHVIDIKGTDCKIFCLRLIEPIFSCHGLLNERVAVFPFARGTRNKS